MTTALVLTSSAGGHASVSTEIVNALVEEMRRREPALQVVTRDLGGTPVPHLTPGTLGGIAGKTDTPAAVDTSALSNTLVAELSAADLLVIGSPMYNFGITSTLKAWFDHVLRAGVTFRYTAEGPVGLMTGKRAIIVESRGGLYSSGPGTASDHQEPHLRTMLTFIGITEVSFIRAEQLAIGPEVRAASIARALEAARGVGDDLRLAA